MSHAFSLGRTFGRSRRAYSPHFIGMLKLQCSREQFDWLFRCFHMAHHPIYLVLLSTFSETYLKRTQYISYYICGTKPLPAFTHTRIGWLTFPRPLCSAMAWVSGCNSLKTFLVAADRFDLVVTTISYQVWTYIGLFTLFLFSNIKHI